MDFDTVRILLMSLEPNIESDINDYKVLIYSTDPLYMGKTMIYGNIPDCFNCKVHAFDIDLDKQIIFIRSEVVNNE